MDIATRIQILCKAILISHWFQYPREKYEYKYPPLSYEYIVGQTGSLTLVW